jgi:hypothetical protein
MFWGEAKSSEGVNSCSNNLEKKGRKLLIEEGFIGLVLNCFKG